MPSRDAPPWLTSLSPGTFKVLFSADGEALSHVFKKAELESKGAALSPHSEAHTHVRPLHVSSGDTFFRLSWNSKLYQPLPLWILHPMQPSIWMSRDVAEGVGCGYYP